MTDREVEAHTVHMAAEHQRAVVGALTDDRLQLVAERLTGDAKTNPSARARLDVVRAEISRRDIARKRNS